MPFMNGDVLIHRPPARAERKALQRQAAMQHHRLERTHQRRDERVIVAAIERVEAIVEAAEADGVERQGGHVVDHLDFVVGV